MAIAVIRPKHFESALQELYKHYPRLKTSLNHSLADIAKNPNQGDRYPGFGILNIRKTRIGMPEYKLSKKNGLRLIYLVTPEKIIWLVIYKKGKPGSENQVKEMVRAALKAIASEFTSEQPSPPDPTA